MYVLFFSVSLSQSDVFTFYETKLPSTTVFLPTPRRYFAGVLAVEFPMTQQCVSPVVNVEVKHYGDHGKGEPPAVSAVLIAVPTLLRCNP